MFCRYVLDLQSWKNILDKLYFSCQITQENFHLISIFQQFSASIKNTLNLKGRLGTRLQFCDVLRFS